jgi:small nuclear ribonucleoprotein (snRNP)-like protein
MDLETNSYYNNFRNVHDECKKNLYYHVILTLKDGKKIDGIIQNVDNENIDMLVGEDVMEGETESTTDMQRQGGYHYGPPNRYRRFRQRRFPFAALAGLSLLSYPYYVQPPYPYSYYPYYPYYPAYY